MTLDPLSLAAGLIAGFIIAWFIAGRQAAVLKERLNQYEQAKGAMGDAFGTVAQEILRQSKEDFLQLAQEKMKQAQADSSHDLEKRQKAVNDLITPIQKNLEKLGSAVEQIQGTDKALREDLHSLSRETARLAGALRDPAGQGRWGEFILEGLLEKSGLMKGVHYETQVALENADGKQRPDAILRLHDGFSIVVDAKAPLNEAAARLGENLSAEDMEELTRGLARQVREHVRALGRKGYWQNIDSPDFTVMFLPSEHMFSMALRADPELVDFASSHNIIISSPTLLMSLLRVVSLGWRQAALAKNAQDISARGAELYQRLSIFGAHLEKVGRGLSGAINSYNDAIGSLERSVLPSARKMKELHVQTAGKDMPEPTLLETGPRALTAPEFAEDRAESKKRA